MFVKLCFLIDFLSDFTILCSFTFDLFGIHLQLYWYCVSLVKLEVFVVCHYEPRGKSIQVQLNSNKTSLVSLPDTNSSSN